MASINMANTTKDTGGLVGTEYRCTLHEDFKPTYDIEKWNEHAKQYPEIHKEQGNTVCVDCKRRINFKGMKYHKVTPQGKNVSLRCPECLRKMLEANKELFQ